PICSTFLSKFIPGEWKNRRASEPANAPTQAGEARMPRSPEYEYPRKTGAGGDGGRRCERKISLQYFHDRAGWLRIRYQRRERGEDRKSTGLNASHVKIWYAVLRVE